MLNEKRILVAPLNWGLGHASRCIPIIKKLIEEGKEVILAAEGEPLKLLQNEFPYLETLLLKGVNIRYPKVLPFSIYFGLKLPQLINSIKQEQESLKSIIENYKIDAVISDNRYGLHDNGIKSILITHQLFVKSNFLEKQVHRFIHKQIAKFDECWIPDFEGDENLSGELSHGESQLENLKYIGPISRFKQAEKRIIDFRRQLIVILSGPEPNRTILEKKVIQQLQQMTLSTLIVRGVVNENYKRKKINDSIELLSYLSSQNLEDEINHSEVVLCRSGYSSIMDLYTLKKKAIIIPTKGQTEQEYLAKYLSEKKDFLSVEEDKLDILSDLLLLNQKK